MDFYPYEDWRMVNGWAPWPNWGRIASAAIVLGCTVGLFIVDAIVLSGIVGIIGMLMLLHGIFGQPEEGPLP